MPSILKVCIKEIYQYLKNCFKINFSHLKISSCKEITINPKHSFMMLFCEQICYPNTQSMNEIPN